MSRLSGFILFLRLPILLVLGLIACTLTLWGQGGLALERSAVLKESLVGPWKTSIGGTELRITFEQDGTYKTPLQRGAYTLSENGLTLKPKDGDEVTYGIDFDQNLLVLSGGNFKQPLKLAADVTLEPFLMNYRRDLMGISWKTIKDKSVRIGVILLIIAASILIIKVLRLVSMWLIYSEWGPLKFIFTKHKSKTRTVHSVVLNVVTYVIIFSALGRVLSELGINYTVYLASLSVIGLAVGFGSQGLVQDLVTGIFLILDGQLSVGDMVEISGQTGKVEELGLRTTRLRNYVGQIVVIPNRNIALVGNYTRGCLRAVIDVAAKDKKSAPRMSLEISKLAQVIHKQFEGTILAPPGAAQILELETGEVFVRITLDLWPAQQSLVDGQFIPRLKEFMTLKGLEIPSDRVAVFYRLPGERFSARWRGLDKSKSS